MKKVLFLIITLLCFTTYVKALPVCNVLTGTGTNIGDEIECKGEHFYVVGSNNNKIKMLTKYNLYYGTYIDITEEKTYSSEGALGVVYDDAYDYCLTIGENYRPRETYVNQWYEGNVMYTTANYVCIDEHEITVNTIKQETNAVAATFDNDGKIIYPVYSYDDRYWFTYHLEYMGFDDTLESYESYLNTIGVSIDSIDLLSIEDVNSIVKDASGKELDLKLKSSESYELFSERNLKNQLNNKYDWLYSTTYVLKDHQKVTNHIVDGSDEWDEIADRFPYIDSYGRIYYQNFIFHSEVNPSPPYYGLRPVVEIDASSLIHRVSYKIAGEGTVKINKENAPEGDPIEFVAEPAEGYVLGEIRVTDANGKTITFTDNKFTMPDANVLIKVVFVKVNPETGDIAIFLFVFMIVISLTVFISNQRKLKELR